MITVKQNHLIVQFLSKKVKAPIPNCQISINPVVIFTEGVTSLLEGLDPCKACVNIPTRFIKETAVDLAPSLTAI